MMRNAAGTASLLNGFWAYQMQAGSADLDWAPVAAAVLSVWACYFSILWIVQGMRSER